MIARLSLSTAFSSTYTGLFLLCRDFFPFVGIFFFNFSGLFPIFKQNLEKVPTNWKQSLQIGKKPKIHSRKGALGYIWAEAARYILVLAFWHSPLPHASTIMTPTITAIHGSTRRSSHSLKDVLAFLEVEVGLANNRISFNAVNRSRFLLNKWL